MAGNLGNADTTGLALKNEITVNLGEISAGITTLQARENVAYAAIRWVRI